MKGSHLQRGHLAHDLADEGDADAVAQDHGCLPLVDSFLDGVDTQSGVHGGNDHGLREAAIGRDNPISTPAISK